MNLYILSYHQNSRGDESITAYNAMQLNSFN